MAQLSFRCSTHARGANAPSTSSDPLEFRGLVEEIVCSEGGAALPEFLERISGQHHHDAGRVFALELGQQIHAVDSGHLDVEDDRIGPVLAKQRLRLEAILRLADDGDVAQVGNQRGQPLPNDE